MISPSVIIVLSGLEHGAYFAERARADAVRQADSFAEIQVLATESTRQLLQTLTSLPAFKTDNLAEMAATLKSVHAAATEYVNLTAVDERGIVSASSLLAPGVDLSQRRHIRSSLLEKRFVAGEYFLNLIDSQPSFAFSAPFFSNAGALKGSISATIRLDSYNRIFDRLKLPKNSILGLLDRNGVRLYVYPEKTSTSIGKPIKPSVWNRILQGGERGTFEDLSSDGVSRIFAFRSLTLEGSSEPYMYVVYATPKADVIAEARSLLFRDIFLMIGVTIFSLACAALLSRKLFGKKLDTIIETAPLQRCEAEKEAVARALADSLAEKNVLLKEIHHRVKNNLQLVLSLVRLQEDTSVDGGIFRKNIESRIAAMAVVHEMLYESNDMGMVSLGSYAERLMCLITASWKSTADFSIQADDIRCNIDTAVPFGLVLNELVGNAFKHAFKNSGPGHLSVSIRSQNLQIVLEVVDDGPGLPPSFSLENSPGLGLHLAQALALQLSGALTWNEGAGARFRLSFPAPDTPDLSPSALARP